MLKDLLKKVRRKAAFGVENAMTTPGRMRDNYRLKQANKTMDSAMNETGMAQTKKMQKAGKTMQSVSENDKMRLKRLNAINYYSKK
jgi:hypothetical protein